MQMKKGHTIQWLKEKGQKDIQWSTKHNSEDARTPLITESELWCSTSGTRRVTPLITESELWCSTSGTRRVTPLITESELWCSTSGTCHVTPLITESKLWCFTSTTRRVVHRFYSDIVADITGWNKTHEEIIGRHDKQEVQ
jgi:hypothetical protein